MSVRTRFAPSPTGALHLGGARTALFNWLYARHCGGKFLWRIEDTDHKRNTSEALTSIQEGLAWLGLEADEPPVFQSARCLRHQDVAMQLLKKGCAYWCTSLAEEVSALKEKARREGCVPFYPSRTESRQDKPSETAILRFRMPREGETSFQDCVQGAVTVRHDQLEDLVLLRADGTPTYMLSVVVDDHDMAISHVIRGTDHLSNTPKQIQLYKALEWSVPNFAHIPLIHGSDGAKLSKRHGALDIASYREAGYLNEALLNALLRLGWGHKDEEFFTMEEAIPLFTLGAVGKSAARFDPMKLRALNAHYLRKKTPDALCEGLNVFLPQEPNMEGLVRLKAGLPGLVVRAETWIDLAASASLYTEELPPPLNEKAQKLMTEDFLSILGDYLDVLRAQSEWCADGLEATTRVFVAEKNLKLGQFAQPLRAVLTGQTISPPLFDVMAVLGKDLCLKRCTARAVKV